jgi:hypothetical protein
VPAHVIMHLTYGASVLRYPVVWRHLSLASRAYHLLQPLCRIFPCIRALPDSMHFTMTLVRPHHLLSLCTLSTGSTDMRRPIDNTLLGRGTLWFGRYRRKVVTRGTHANLLKLLSSL